MSELNALLGAKVCTTHFVEISRNISKVALMECGEVTRHEDGM